MSVKIARLKGGEDVIADIKEVSAKEDENKTAIAFMFRDPYTVILDDQSEIEMEMWGEGDEEMEEEQEILASNKEAIEKNHIQQLDKVCLRLWQRLIKLCMRTFYAEH